MVGEHASYTLTVSNVGNAAATVPITITDTLPLALTYVSASGTGWDCTSTSPPKVTCTTDTGLGPFLGPPPPPSLPPITVVVSVGPGAVPSVTNEAMVASDCGDLNLQNNTDDDTVRVTFLTPAPLLSPVGLLIAVALVLGVGFHGLRTRRLE